MKRFPAFCSAFYNSRSAMDDFVERHNIAHYRNRLKTETDPFRRTILLDLLAEEEAKQAMPSTVARLIRRTC
jgi:hypothetical protein